MCLLIDMSFNSGYGLGNGTVTALFLKTFQAGKDTLGKDALLLLDCLYILILLFLFQIPAVDRKKSTEYP